MKIIEALKGHVSRLEKHAAALSIKPESCSTDLTLDEIKGVIHLIERQQADLLSCFGSYVEASGVARDAIRAISNTLTKGMHHSRPSLEQDFTSLKLRLQQCEFGKESRPADIICPICKMDKPAKNIICNTCATKPYETLPHQKPQSRPVPAPVDR